MRQNATRDIKIEIKSADLPGYHPKGDETPGDGGAAPQDPNVVTCAGEMHYVEREELLSH
jgi:hypothetical protein